MHSDLPVYKGLKPVFASHPHHASHHSRTAYLSQGHGFVIGNSRLSLCTSRLSVDRTLIWSDHKIALLTKNLKAHCV